ncbi:hypothetical protein PCASD_05706 [Puccinia coronata f. sp. avenae]|uniref:Uncharacterized protein n=1 Tax=Puccinia coronata f. sp. avenae TaxID=200324 RepID=A0A2N5UVD5_9BASI|nr:hypothetical protein PCASD_05706 [Puccinia coronata f. sp. avenae]
MMAKPEDASIEDLVKQFSTLSSSMEPRQQLDQHRRLVVQGLKNLTSKCSSIIYSHGSSTHENNLPKLFERNEERRLLWKQLETAVLPCLRHRITALSLSLDPTDLRKDHKEKLNVVMGVLSEVEQSMNQTQACITTIAPVLKANLVTNDQELGELKSFRSGRLRHQMEDLLRVLSGLFSSCADFVGRFGSSLNEDGQGRAEVLSNTSLFWKTIDKTIEWFGRSELNLVQDRWLSEVDLVDDALNELTELINRPELEEEGEDKPRVNRMELSFDDDDDDDDDSGEDRSSAEVIALAKMVVPIVKLSRLILNKLSKMTIDTQALVESKQEMSSSQLEALLSLTSTISLRVDEMVDTLSDGDHAEARFTREMMMESCQSLSQSFEQMLCTLDVHIIPFIIMPTPSQHDASLWFSQWNTQFSLAALNCMKHVSSFRTTSSSSSN